MGEDEDEENADWIYGADEESILNADDFDSEYFEAIDCARKQAQIDGEKILSIISEQFEQETGDQATEEMLEQALDTFAESDIEESAESENDEEVEESEDSEKEEEFRSEYEAAIQNVKKLGTLHQEQLFEAVVEIFASSNGYEPSLNEVYEIFDGIKEDFADEAREQFLSDLDEESEEEIKEVQDDLEEDYESSEEEEVQNID